MVADGASGIDFELIHASDDPRLVTENVFGSG